MKLTMLRRRGLGLGSCKGIVAASLTGIDFVRNDKQFPNNSDMCIRWGCTSNIPEGMKVLNTAKAIHTVNDKSEFRKPLDEAELCPETWWDQNDVGAFDYPVIVRPKKHAQGRKVFLCKDKIELVQAIGKCGVGYYISKFIDKKAEYRVFVVQGRVACVAEKTPADKAAVAWNVAKGGRFDNVRWDEWPLRAVKISVEAFNLSGLDFGGVDVMVDEDGKPYIIEINSAPSLTSEYRQGCMAKCFDYISENGKDSIPIIEERGGYRKFVHPAVCERALLV